MQEEIWKPVKGHEQFYEVSSFGRVKRLSRVIKQTHLNYNPLTWRHLPEKIMKQFYRNGYLFICLSGNGKLTNFSTHRLVAQNFLDDYCETLEVNHIDGNRSNNSISNLEMCTRKENMQHASKVLGVMKGKGRKVIDTATGKIYDSIKDAHADYSSPWTVFHFSNMLSGNRKNKTTLKYA